MSGLDHGQLSPANVDQQFCSVWLKDEIRRLFAELSAEKQARQLAESDISVKHKYRADVLERQLESERARHTEIMMGLMTAVKGVEAWVSTPKLFEANPNHPLIILLDKIKLASAGGDSTPYLANVRMDSAVTAHEAQLLRPTTVSRNEEG